MLTADLVQVAVRGDRLHPRYVDPSDESSLSLATSLVRIFEDHVGKPRAELDEELRELLGTGTAFLLHRGLAKLLLDRCEFLTSAKVEPAALRRAVFEKAAEVHRASPTETFDHGRVLEPVGRSFELEPVECERNLYADLKEEQVLEVFKGCYPEWLLDRYNVALAQALLLRAIELEVELPAQEPTRYRELFRKIKFCQLLYRVDGRSDSGYRLRLDGPMSLFKSSHRYGLQMANFLPNVLHCEGWSLKATVLWGKARREKTFVLTPKDDLKPTTYSRGQWIPDEVRWLCEQFRKLDSDWDVSTDAELVDLGGRGVLVPDYVFRHRPSGKRVVLELFGFWRRGAVDSRLELLRKHGPENLILGLGSSLRVGEEELGGVPGEIYVFRNAPVARELLGLLQRFVDEE